LLHSARVERIIARLFVMADTFAKTGWAKESLAVASQEWGPYGPALATFREKQKHSYPSNNENRPRRL